MAVDEDLFHFLGAIWVTLLQGIQISQTTDYFLQSKSDRLWIKLLVSGLLLANLLYTCLMLPLIFRMIVSKVEPFTVTDKFLFQGCMTIATYVSITVQIFFFYRINRLTQKRWVLFATIFLTFVQIVFSTAVIIVEGIWVWSNSLTGNKWVDPVLIGMTTIAATNDVFISAVLIHTLRSSRTGFAVIDDLLQKIIRTTVQTGAITSTAAIVAFVTFVTMPNSHVFCMFLHLLPQLYANTLLSALNARKYWEACIHERTVEYSTMRFASNPSAVRSTDNEPLEFGPPKISKDLSYPSSHTASPAVITESPQ
jgi:hypothetical protein